MLTSLLMAVSYRVHVMTVPGADPERDRMVKTFVGSAGGACVHEDPDRNGIMWNWRRALACAAEDGTDWSVISSDDAEPLPGWERHLPRALGFSPRPLLGPLHFGYLGRRVAEEGYAYSVGTGFLWGGIIAYRTAVLPDLIEYTRRFLEIDPEYPHDDVIAGCFADRFHGKPAMTARAIFDHIPVKSLVGHPSHEGEMRRPSLTIREVGPPWNTPGFARGAAWLGGDRAKAVVDKLGLQSGNCCQPWTAAGRPLCDGPLGPRGGKQRCISRPGLACSAPPPQR